MMKPIGPTVHYSHTGRHTHAHTRTRLALLQEPPFFLHHALIHYLHRNGGGETVNYDPTAADIKRQFYLKKWKGGEYCTGL